MTNVIVDYVWIGSEEPQSLKCKTRILHIDLHRYSGLDSYMGNTPRLIPFSDLERIPVWEEKSDILKPIKLYKISDRYIILCEVCDKDNKPLSTDYRNQLNTLCSKLPKTSLSVRQKFTINNSIFMHTDNNYYCDVNTYGYNITEEYINTCLDLKIPVDDINSEKIFGQWTYQLSSSDIISIVDDLWISRFMLHKICNKQKESVIFNELYTKYKGNILIISADDNPYKLLIDWLKG